MEEAVFQYLLSTEDFQDISVSPLSKSFFKFAVENNNIDGILQFAVRHKKLVLPRYYQKFIVFFNELKTCISSIFCSYSIYQSMFLKLSYIIMIPFQFYKYHLLTLIFSISRIKEAVTLLKMLCSHNSLLSKRLESYREESMLKVGEIGQIRSCCWRWSCHYKYA